METITSNSNRTWISEHSLKLDRYLRRFHKKDDRDTVSTLIFWSFPDEGRKLIQNLDVELLKTSPN